uniref:Uncharacterized protein n=1 Tax=Engystomops pustulosus TaxID=76066 RepID=A0AAV6Z0W8_ENGPU|nr:hypothetical protein GDO81_028243 [Engystomops pustulosus]
MENKYAQKQSTYQQRLPNKDLYCLYGLITLDLPSCWRQHRAYMLTELEMGLRHRYKIGEGSMHFAGNKLQQTKWNWQMNYVNANTL